MLPAARDDERQGDEQEALGPYRSHDVTHFRLRFSFVQPQDRHGGSIAGVQRRP